MNRQVHVVSFEAVPLEASDASDQASGAHVNVYVLTSTHENARQRAAREKRDAGWEISSSMELTAADGDFFATGSDGLAYYEQCLIDGIVIVIHRWRHEH